MLTPPSPICSPTSTLTHSGLKALYVVLVLTWPTDHSALKFTAGMGRGNSGRPGHYWVSQKESYKGSVPELVVIVYPFTSPGLAHTKSANHYCGMKKRVRI